VALEYRLHHPESRLDGGDLTMSAHVQMAAVLFVAGFAGMVVMIVTAHLLVAVASWAYSLVGAWAWLPVVALVAWVGWVEKRRWAR